MKTKEMETFERAMWLRELKAGDTVTERHMEALEYFLGDILKAVRELKPQVTTIHFDKVGQAHSIDNDGVIESVNGKKL